MPLFLLSALGFLKSLVTAIGTWLSRRSLTELALLGCAVLICVQFIGLRAERRHSAKLQAQIVKCTSARRADQLAYAKAQSDAQAKNLADVARDKAERERITHDVSQSYEAELASLRADLARRLLAQPSGHKGAPGQPGLPGVSESPGGVDGEARVSIPTGLYVRGAELELQLERLQGWVEQQSQVKR